MIDPSGVILTASVVVHRTPAWQLQAVLGSLRADGVTSVSVVDNSPDDRLRDVACGFEGVSYIRVPNRGYGAAHNVAIRRSMASGATHHLLLNPDVRWEPGWWSDCSMKCAARLGAAWSRHGSSIPTDGFSTPAVCCRRPLI